MNARRICAPHRRQRTTRRRTTIHVIVRHRPPEHEFGDRDSHWKVLALRGVFLDVGTPTEAAVS